MSDNIKVTEIQDGTQFIMTTQFGVNKVEKLCGDILTPLNRDIAYFTYADRPGKVTRERFILGMKEEPGGTTKDCFVIYQFEIDRGNYTLQPIP